MTALPAVDLDGLAIHQLDAAGVVAEVGRSLAAGRGGWLATVNLQYMACARRDREFHALLSSADLRVADGMPVVWASRLAGQPVPARVAGVDLVPLLAGACAVSGHAVAMVGGLPGAAEETAGILRGRFPGLRVGPVECPPLGFSRDEAAQERVLASLSASAPGLVLVGLGVPVQDRLIARWRSRLPGAWLIGVGGSFDLISGRTRRAPGWMRNSGLEWAHRLVSNPGRLARRYLIECLPYGAGLLLRSGLRRRRR